MGGRGAVLEHGCLPQGAGKKPGDVEEVCKEIASLGDGHPVTVTLPREGRRPPWGCSFLTGRKCQAGSKGGGAGDGCLAPHLRDADKPVYSLPCASVSLSKAPSEKGLGECPWLWPPNPAVQHGVRNQRYLIEKMKGYAESFPPAPSSWQELPALTTSAVQAVLGAASAS